MSTVVMAGVSHHTIDLPDFERFTMCALQREKLRAGILAEGFAEVTVLSTCSRVEVYAVTGASDQAGERSAEHVRNALTEAVGGGPSGAFCRTHVGDAAVAHLFRVAAGLDSRLLGEQDVQGQVSSAARDAGASRGAANSLRRLMAAALVAARAVHRDPAIGDAGRSLGARAVVRGLQLAGNAPELQVVVVGSGTMARLVVDALTARGLTPAVVARDLGAARRLTGHGGRAGPLDQLCEQLKLTDLIIVATSAGHQLLTAQQVRTALRHRPDRALTVIDLAVPRNVEPAVGSVPGVVLLDIRGLHDTADDGPQRAQIAGAEKLTADAATRYNTDQRARAAGPLLRQMREQTNALCRQQLLRATGGTLEPAELDRATATVVGRLLHTPTLLVKAAAAAGNKELLSVFTSAYQPDHVDTTPPKASLAQQRTHRSPGSGPATSYRCQPRSVALIDQSWPY